jgi:Na+/proline symporter
MFAVTGISAAIPYCPPSLFNYRISERTALVIGPIICLLAGVMAIVIRRRLDRTILPFVICAIISFLPLIRITVVFLLWKLRGFAP